jgi:hypothetical protein
MTASLDALSDKHPHLDRRNSPPASGLETDFVAPVQFYDLIRRSPFLHGETRLVFAVLRGRSSHVSATARFPPARRPCRICGSRAMVRSGDRVRSLFLRVRLRGARNRTRIVSASTAILPQDVLPMKQMRSVGRRHRVRGNRYEKKRSRRSASPLALGSKEQLENRDWTVVGNLD